MTALKVNQGEGGGGWRERVTISMFGYSNQKNKDISKRELLWSPWRLIEESIKDIRLGK